MIIGNILLCYMNDAEQWLGKMDALASECGLAVRYLRLASDISTSGTAHDCSSNLTAHPYTRWCDLLAVLVDSEMRDSERLKAVVVQADSLGRRIVGIRTLGPKGCVLPDTLARMADVVLDWDCRNVAVALTEQLEERAVVERAWSRTLALEAESSSPTIWTYKIAADWGFAPNPFHGVCTLACCKHQIRDKAEIGDWVVGAGTEKLGNRGRIIFAMKVEGRLTFDEYWTDTRFLAKRHSPGASCRRSQGDNVHQKDPLTGKYNKIPLHHCCDPDETYLRPDSDTRSEWVLYSRKFFYFGADAIAPPEISGMRDDGQSIRFPHDTRNRFKNYPENMRVQIVKWLEEQVSFGVGLRGFPGCWCSGQPKRDERYVSCKVGRREPNCLPESGRQTAGRCG